MPEDEPDGMYKWILVVLVALAILMLLGTIYWLRVQKIIDFEDVSEVAEEYR